MRSYDELIDVRRGLVGGQDAPACFRWRGRPWKVLEILSSWVETGAWWEQSSVAALFGSDGDASCAELLGERELWRVEAGRSGSDVGAGVFDLAFDWALGQWHLVRVLD